MAMIVMQGQIINMFKSNDGVDRETGAVRPGKFKIQIMGKMPLMSGESQLQMHDLSCPEPEVFKPFQNKWIQCPLGIMSSGDSTILYIPKGSKPIEIDSKNA